MLGKEVEGWSKVGFVWLRRRKVQGEERMVNGWSNVARVVVSCGWPTWCWGTGVGR